MLMSLELGPGPVAADAVVVAWVVPVVLAAAVAVAAAAALAAVAAVSAAAAPILWFSKRMLPLAK
jgi:hypothetical protein